MAQAQGRAALAAVMVDPASPRWAAAVAGNVLKGRVDPVDALNTADVLTAALDAYVRELLSSREGGAA